MKSIGLTAALASLMLNGGFAAQAVEQGPAILFASITENPGVKDVASRPVTLRIELDGPPVCSGAGGPSYGFLIDADRTAETGTALEAIPELGIEGRVTIDCDRSRGQFVSAVGTVTTSIDPSSKRAVLQLRSQVGRLPSTDFAWVAYASRGDLVSMVPESPLFAVWSIHERSDH